MTGHGLDTSDARAVLDKKGWFVVRGVVLEAVGNKILKEVLGSVGIGGNLAIVFIIEARMDKGV
jgi:hypothetical protein